jgi:branched-chain amino acid transport system permease protein
MKANLETLPRGLQAVVALGLLALAVFPLIGTDFYA